MRWDDGVRTKRALTTANLVFFIGRGERVAFERKAVFVDHKKAETTLR